MKIWKRLNEEFWYNPREAAPFILGVILSVICIVLQIYFWTR